MVSSFALLVAAQAASPTADEIMAAHRARTSVVAMAAREADERKRMCANPQATADDEVLVCGRRDDGRYRVPASDGGERGPGAGGLHSVEAVQAAAVSCTGANLCERPVFDGNKAFDFLFKVVRALTDGE